MMTELDQLISNAFASEGEQAEVNKVYLALLRTELFVPVEKMLDSKNADEPFKPLFAKIEEKYFILAFDTLDRLTTWAGDELLQIDYVILSGRDMVAGINEEVYLCLNLGALYYKEFSPDEIRRLKMIVSRIEQMR